MNDAFSLKDVKKTYKGFSLDLKDVSLERGFVMGLIGRNGAGKSTTIKILLNLIHPDSGDVRVLGLRQPEDEMRIKTKVGYVSEEPVFYEAMTVEWMANFVARYYPTWDHSLYQSYLKRYSLEPRKKVKDLSKGMKVKLGLMLALSHRPDLLVLDEPTSGIDPVIRHELLSEISDVIRDEGRTVLLSSHITQDVEQVADFVGIIDKGVMVEFGDKESLMERWRRIDGVVGDGCDRSKLSSLLSGVKVDATSFMGVTGRYTPDLLDRLKTSGASDLRVTGMNLDEVLVALAGRED